MQVSYIQPGIIDYTKAGDPEVSKYIALTRAKNRKMKKQSWLENLK